MSRHRPRRNRSHWLLGALASLLIADPAQAASRVSVTATSVAFAGLQAHDVEFVLTPPGDSPATARFYATVVDGKLPSGPLQRLRLDCRRLSVSGDTLRCAGRLSGDFGAAGQQDTALDARIDGAGRAELQLDSLQLAGGRLRAHATLAGKAWTLESVLQDLQLEQLRALAGERLPLPPETTVGGRLSGAVQAQGQGAAVQAASADLAIGPVQFADAAGVLAGEQLQGLAAGTLTALPANGGWAFELSAAAAAGQAYVEPWFVDFDANGARLEASGTLPPGLRTASFERLALAQDGVVMLTGSGELDLGDGPLLTSLQLALQSVDLAGALPIYLQPPLVATAFKDLTGSGTLRGEIDIALGLPTRIELDLADVMVASIGGGVAIEGVEGHFSWFDEASRNELAQRVDSAVFKSLLGWRAARLWGIEFGAAELPFTTTGRHFRLLEPVLLPIFDGGLDISTFRVRHAGRKDMYVRFDADVKPISVALVGRALGWPEFSGSLSGRIPRLELADGYVTLGGNLEAQVFDGLVTVRDLRLRDPLGPFPQLFAEVDIDRLDLEYITSTFEFGVITGRLSGRIEGLEMFDWMPVRFDGRLYSTPGDDSRRRISQRAVANLSSIGGGSGGTVTSALQGGFLRFFDSFRYRRLGLSCRLENDVCTMDGVGPAKGGYYIVQGSGLPRIDVIGNQRQVAWTRLVRQLAAMTQSPGPIIE
jgi:hypothetical protein